MPKSNRSFPMLVPSATVFFSSACVMIIELVASRLVARDLGSSLYTWTSIIGVVLAGIAIGNYLGGRIADRFPARRALAVLFALASLSCATIVVLNGLVGQWMWLWRLSWPLHVFLHVSLVFLVPSTLLGTISPVVAKMALDQGLATGRTVGNIYAWGAAGSIAGTFLAGFYLIVAFGTVAIIWTIGGAMLVMALLYWVKFWFLYVWAIGFVVLATLGTAPTTWAENAGAAIGLRDRSDPNILYADETPYCYVAVHRVSEKPDQRRFMQDALKHSDIDMDDITNLEYFYTNIYAGLTAVLGKGREDLSMMVIGGGGYTFPQYLKHFWPDAYVEVVEIDPGVTEAAMQAFGLDRHPDIKTIPMDARNHVDLLLKRAAAGESVRRYDFIYEDAINDYSVPFQLVTREFNEKILAMLKDDGVYMINLIDTYDNAQFLGAVVNTLQESFPHVHVVTSDVSLPMLRNTFVVVGSRQPIDPPAIFAEYDEHLKLWFFSETDLEHVRGRSRGVILTDDYAPVENMLAPVVRQSAKEKLAVKYLAQARWLQRQQQWGESIRRYEQAMALNPSMSIKACNEIGLMRVAQGSPEKGIEAFQTAVVYHTDTGSHETAIASIYLNLGILQRQNGQPEQAMESLKKAVQWFRAETEADPDSAVTWDRLGESHASMGQFKLASDAFQRACALEPGNPVLAQKLSKALEFQGRYREAADVLRKLAASVRQQGDQARAAELDRYIQYLEYQATQKKPIGPTR